MLSKEKLEKTSLQKLEILCSLDFTNNEEAFNEQLQIAAYLAEIYEFGGKRASRDLLKADKYRRQANQKEASPSSVLNGTQAFYTLSGLYNFGRLYVLRVGMVAEFFKRAFLPTLYGIAGLGYFIDVGFDAVDILATTFRGAATEDERKLSYWQLRAQRFKNAINEEGRLAHLENALVWAILNAVTFAFAGILPAVVLSSITAGGLGHDLFAEFFKGGREYIVNKELLDEYTKELNQKRAALAELKLQKDSIPTADESNYQKRLADAEKEVQKLECYQSQLQGAVKGVKLKRAYIISSVAITLVGIGLMLFPPTLAFGIPITIFGLGLNLGEKIKEAYDFFKPAPPLKKPNFAHPEPAQAPMEPSEEPRVPGTYNRLVPQLKASLGSIPEEKEPLLASQTGASEITASDTIVPEIEAIDNAKNHGNTEEVPVLAAASSAINTATAKSDLPQPSEIALNVEEVLPKATAKEHEVTPQLQAQSGESVGLQTNSVFSPNASRRNTSVANSDSYQPEQQDDVDPRIVRSTQLGVQP